MEDWDLYPLSLYHWQVPLQTPVVLHCERLSIHFLEKIVQNIRVVYPKAVILYGGFLLSKTVT